jgi:hypothetical protein
MQTSAKRMAAQAHRWLARGVNRGREIGASLDFVSLYGDLI